MQFEGRPVRKLRLKRKDGFYKIIWDCSKPEEFINHLDYPSEAINLDGPPAPGEVRFKHKMQCREYRLPLFIEI